MGYTHYWYRKKEIKPDTFQAIKIDFEKILEILKKAIKLADGMGEGVPQITDNLISFNGQRQCGHIKQELGVSWPSDNAKGISSEIDKSHVGSWFAGAEINTRTCGGDCAHESLYFPQNRKIADYETPKNGMYFDFCKTAFKPYDLAVITFMIIAKHHLKEIILVSSDGTQMQWFDGMALCEEILCYGMGFALDE